MKETGVSKQNGGGFFLLVHVTPSITKHAVILQQRHLRPWKILVYNLCKTEMDTGGFQICVTEAPCKVNILSARQTCPNAHGDTALYIDLHCPCA